MTLSNMTAKVRDTIRALLQKYGSFSKLPAEAKALVREALASRPPQLTRQATPAAVVPVPPTLVAPDVSLTTALRVLGFSAAVPHAPTLAAWREQIHRRLSARASERMTELGFPVQLPALSARADSDPAVHDSPAARLAVLAAELECSVDDLRKEDSEDMTRARIERRIGTMALDGIAANVGFPEASLPPSYSAGDYAADDLEGIQQQLASEKDPVRAGQLAEKANAIRNRRWANRERS